MKKNNNLKWTLLTVLLLISSVSAINFISPTESNNTYFNRNFIAINVTVDNIEETQNEANITFYLFNSSTQLNATNFTSGSRGINFTGLNSNMKYWYNVTVRNSSGFANSTETRIITLDSTNPAISFSSDTLANNTYKNQNFIYINVSNVTDTNFRNITFYLYNSSTQLNSSTHNDSTISVNFTNLDSNMQYWYNVTTYDNASNSNRTETRKITLDSTQPSIALTYPTVTSYTSGDYVQFTVTDTNLNNKRWSLDGGKTNYTAFVNTDDIDTLDNAFLGKGDVLTITYWANDSAGNNKTSTFDLVVTPYIGDVKIIRTSGGGVSPTTPQGQPLGAKPDIIRDTQNAVSGASKLASGSFFGLPNVLVGLIVVLIVFVIVAMPKKKRGRRRG